MYKDILITSLLFFIIWPHVGHSSEKFDSYLLPITRGHETQTRVSINFWSGEYPSPVIDLNAKTKGQTTVKAFKSLRVLKDQVDCTIANGLYHPWGPKTSALEFYSLLANDEYEVLISKTFEGEMTVTKGEKISQVVGLSEGACRAKQIGKKSVNVEFNCALLDDSKVFKQLNKEKTPWQEQWIFLNCKEGYKAFIEDKEFLNQKGARTGEIKEYGKVGPAQ